MLLTEMLGAPFPAETSITLAGVAWGQGLFSFVPLYVCVVLGNVAGSSISFAIGYYLGRPFVLKVGRFVGLTAKRLDGLEHRFHGSRAFIVIIGKFVSIIRLLVPLLAGINRMKFWTFSLYNALSALVWGALFLVEGRYLDELWKHKTILHSTSALGIVLGIVLTTIVVRKLFFR